MIHRLEAAAIASGLQTSRVARRIIVLDSLPSTNDYALDAVAAGEGSAADGTTVFAEFQTAGRGRLGRSWLAPRGSALTFTALLWEARLPASPVRWIMAASVAVARGIAATSELEPAIRWPNDIYIRGKKVCGILVEVRNLPGGWAVAIGIGINCLQQSGHFAPDLRNSATSIEIESRHPVDRVRIAQAVLRELDTLLGRGSGIDDASLAELWRERSSDFGARTTLRCDGHDYSGVIIDVQPQTGLVLQLDGGARKLFDPAITTRVS